MSSPRTRPTRAQTRRQILDAAAALFAARGFDGASLDQVAAAAGLTKGAVYSSFASKDELFSALVADRLDQRLAIVTEAAGDERRSLRQLFIDTEDDLAALFSDQRDWHLLFIECWIRAMRAPERREAWARQRGTTRAVISDFFHRHSEITGDALPMPASDLALVVMALSNGLAMETIADPGAADAGLFARTLAQLMTP